MMAFEDDGQQSGSSLAQGDTTVGARTKRRGFVGTRHWAELKRLLKKRWRYKPAS